MSVISPVKFLLLAAVLGSSFFTSRLFAETLPPKPASLPGIVVCSEYELLGRIEVKNGRTSFLGQAPSGLPVIVQLTQSAVPQRVVAHLASLDILSRIVIRAELSEGKYQGDLQSLQVVARDPLGISGRSAPTSRLLAAQGCAR